MLLLTLIILLVINSFIESSRLNILHVVVVRLVVNLSSLGHLWVQLLELLLLVQLWLHRLRNLLVDACMLVC